MSIEPKPNAYCYAWFLCELFPTAAIQNLQDDCIRERVEAQVKTLAESLGPYHDIMGLLERRRFAELVKLKREHDAIRSSSSSPVSTDRRPAPLSRGSEVLPHTPDSTGMDVALRFEKITVLHGVEEFPMFARRDGTCCAIGEDKLERLVLQGVRSNWSRHPDEVITIDGVRIPVGQFVELTWNRPGEPRTLHNSFWVVPPGIIAGADILLGPRNMPRRQEEDHGS